MTARQAWDHLAIIANRDRAQLEEQGWRLDGEGGPHWTFFLKSETVYYTLGIYDERYDIERRSEFRQAATEEGR